MSAPGKRLGRHLSSPHFDSEKKATKNKHARRGFGYVHVLNLARLEWLCQVKLTYGGFPLGWDGFTWCADSLVFITPHKMSVLTPEEFKRVHAKELLANKSEEEDATNSKQGVVGLDEEEEEEEATEAPKEKEKEKEAELDVGVDAPRELLTPGVLCIPYLL